jgi:hypothetical protein
VYSRELDGELLDLGVSGKLWNGVLVMFDRQSDTLWTQVDGRAIQGDRTGARLEHRESVFTNWATWLAEHPDTLVLQKDEGEREQEGSHYADYFADPEAVFFPELAEDLGGIGPKDVVFGLRVGDDALGVDEQLLVRQGLVSAVVGNRPVALARDPDSGFVLAFERELDGRTLFPAMVPGSSPLDELYDTAAHAIFQPSDLPRVRVDRAFWYAFAKSFPGAAVLVD